MRTSILGALILAACGGTPRTTATRPPPAIGTGDPVPQGIAEPTACAPSAGGYRWLGSEPHVPLAVSGPGSIAHVEAACCAPWGREGEVWTEVDAWGAPVAERRITGGEGYDVSQCYELVTDAEESAGHPLLVHGDAPWTAPPSARWEPSDAERASLLAFVDSVDRVFAPPLVDDIGLPPQEPRPPAERVVYFQLPDDPGGNLVITRYAAIGGRALVIAGLDPAGTWRTQYVDASWGIAAGPWIADAYRVLAVFDVDGDGFAEVLVHRTDGPSCDDAILECAHDSGLRPWSVVAESIGGATL